MSTSLPLRLITALIASMTFAALPLAAHEAGTNPDSWKRAVVIVVTYDNHGKPLLQGSGFFIEPGRIVTNLHVIRHASEIRVTTFSGKTFTAQSVVVAEDSDLALIQTDGTTGDTFLQIESTPPTEGESIILISNPQGSHWKVTSGRVGKMWQFADTSSRMQITAGVFPGSSGGPVINRRGHVVGIAVMRMDSADDLSFAIPAENLKPLQASAGIAGSRAGLTSATQPLATSRFRFVCKRSTLRSARIVAT